MTRARDGRDILRNLPRRSTRIVGMRQMSQRAASRTQSLVMQYGLSIAAVANSFPFFTGLCEKESRCTLSLALSAVAHK